MSDRLNALLTELAYDFPAGVAWQSPGSGCWSCPDMTDTLSSNANQNERDVVPTTLTSLCQFFPDCASLRSYPPLYPFLSLPRTLPDDVFFRLDRYM